MKRTTRATHLAVNALLALGRLLAGYIVGDRRQKRFGRALFVVRRRCCSWRHRLLSELASGAELAPRPERTSRRLRIGLFLLFLSLRILAHFLSERLLELEVGEE